MRELSSRDALERLIENDARNVDFVRRPGRMLDRELAARVAADCALHMLRARRLDDRHLVDRAEENLRIILRGWDPFDERVWGPL